MLAFLAHVLYAKQILDARDGIAQRAVSVVQLRTALQGQFAFCFSGIYEDYPDAASN